MDRRTRPAKRRRSPIGLGLLAILLIPLLLVLHAPVLAAVVPGALLTVASLDANSARGGDLASTIALVAADDLLEQERIAGATLVSGPSRVL